jgi:phage regulator Rha-like protein
MTNSPKTGVPNFGPTSFIGSNGEEYPCFTMTRAGFSLLAMGFTMTRYERRIEARRARRQAAGSGGM